MKQPYFWNVLALALLILGGISCEHPALESPSDPVLPAGSYRLPDLEGPFSDAQLRALIREELDSVKMGNPGDKGEKPMQVPKQNSKPIFVHYMPWFQNRDYDGFWGQH